MLFYEIENKNMVFVMEIKESSPLDFNDKNSVTPSGIRMWDCVPLVWELPYS